MRAHSRVRWLPALLVISLALPACRTPSPKKDQPSADTTPTTTSTTTPATSKAADVTAPPVDPRIKRFDCDVEPEICFGLGYRAYTGGSVLMTPAEGLALLEMMCRQEQVAACAIMANLFTMDIALHDMDEEEPFESVTGLDKDALEDRISELDEKTIRALAGSCEAAKPERCHWLLDAHLRHFFASEPKIAPGEDKKLIALFERGETLCLAGGEDRFQLCNLVSTWLMLSSENYPDKSRYERVNAHLQSLARPSCPAPKKRYSPEGCYDKPARTSAALAACKAGDELGCADLVNARAEEIAEQDANIAQMSRIVALSMDLDALPAKYSQLTEEQREQGSSILEFYYKSREERDALLPGWREAHRAGCVEGKVEEICASWKKACEEAMSSKECQGIP